MYARLRSLLPAQEDVSEYEDPLTCAELAIAQQGFQVEGLRYFRLPFVPLLHRIERIGPMHTHKLSDRVLKRFPFTQRYATVVVMKNLSPPQR